MNYFIYLFKRHNNPRAFSLVELLIVIAIIGLLAVLAFNAFRGILLNSKRKGDEQKSKRIEHAMKLFINDTSINDLTIPSRFSVDKISTKQYETTKTGIEELIKDLKGIIYVKDSKSNWNSFGPYLNNISVSEVSTYDSYAPLWNLASGGLHTGYMLQIVKATNNVACIPVTGNDSTAPTIFDISSNPGILVLN